MTFELILLATFCCSGTTCCQWLLYCIAQIFPSQKFLLDSVVYYIDIGIFLFAPFCCLDFILLFFIVVNIIIHVS